MLSDNFVKDHVVVPISSIIKPLFVFGDYEGDYKKKFCSLPKQNRGKIF